MILAGLSSITEELSGNFLYNSLLGDHNITTELLHRLMEQTIEPAVRGYTKKHFSLNDSDEKCILHFTGLFYLWYVLFTRIAIVLFSPVSH